MALAFSFLSLHGLSFFPRFFSFFSFLSLFITFILTFLFSLFSTCWSLVAFDTGDPLWGRQLRHWPVPVYPFDWQTKSYNVWSSFDDEPSPWRREYNWNSSKALRKQYHKIFLAIDDGETPLLVACNFILTAHYIYVVPRRVQRSTTSGLS